jgi:hypothetical protein
MLRSFLVEGCVKESHQPAEGEASQGCKLNSFIFRKTPYLMSAMEMLSHDL